MEKCEFKNCIKGIDVEDTYLNGKTYCKKHYNKVWNSRKLNNKGYYEYKE